MAQIVTGLQEIFDVKHTIPALILDCKYDKESAEETKAYKDSLRTMFSMIGEMSPYDPSSLKEVLPEKERREIEEEKKHLEV